MSDTNILLVPTRRFQLRISWLVLLAYALPLIGMPYCILRTFLLDFKDATWNHCRVWNIIPSLSSVVKSQRTSWRMFTYMHLPFRVLFACLYFGYYRRKLNRQQHCCIYLATVLFVQDTITTVTLAIFAEVTGSHALHVTQALSLWISSCGYMLITYFLNKYHRREAMEENEYTSLKLKQMCLWIAFIAQICMWPFYMLHNGFCVPLAYSMFSILEVVFMLAILSYHATAYYDFYHMNLCYNKKTGWILSEF